MILVDTNIIAGTLQPAHRHYQAATDAMARLAVNEGEQFHVSVHNLYELYFLMTRSVVGNGFGYTAQQAKVELAGVEELFQKLSETPRSYETWKALVSKYGITNRQCFDAKIVASMIENSIPRILAFNDKDFEGYVEIKTLNPFDVLGAARVK